MKKKNETEDWLKKQLFALSFSFFEEEAKAKVARMARVKKKRFKRDSGLASSSTQGFDDDLSALNTALRETKLAITSILRRNEAHPKAAFLLIQQSRQQISSLIEKLIPWRKGPYCIDFLGFIKQEDEPAQSKKIDAKEAENHTLCAFLIEHSISIESEWQSHLKWQRIRSHIIQLFQKDGKAALRPEDFLAEKSICDIGGNNGYFAFRLAEAGARHVLVLEPSHLYFQQFRLLSLLRSFHLFQWPDIQDIQALSKKDAKSSSPCHALTKPKFFQDLHSKIFFSQHGFQALNYMKNSFDMLFLLGILYHHPNPSEILQLSHKALKKKGLLIVDCQCMDGPEGTLAPPLPNKSMPYLLYPGSRYTGKKGFYFLPSQAALILWLKRCGFQDIQVFYNEYLLPNEQASTKHCPWPSLEDGLISTEDRGKIESLYAKKDGKTASKAFSLEFSAKQPAYTTEAHDHSSANGLKSKTYISSIEGYPLPKRVYLSARIA